MLKKIQAFVAKEFLWLLAAAILALPIAVLLAYLSTRLQAPTQPTLYSNLKTSLNDSTTLLNFYFYLLSVLTVYLTRMVKGAIQTLIPKS